MCRICEVASRGSYRRSSNAESIGGRSAAGSIAPSAAGSRRASRANTGGFFGGQSFAHLAAPGQGGGSRRASASNLSNLFGQGGSLSLALRCKIRYRILLRFCSKFHRFSPTCKGCIEADFCNQTHFFCSILRNLQEYHSFAPLQVQYFSKFSSESFSNFQNLKNSVQNLDIFHSFHRVFHRI